MGEIFPSRVREAGIAIGTSTQWLFNFVFSQATPHAVQNLGWRTFLMFAIFNWALLVFVWIFIKETKGKSLEEMEAREFHPLWPRFLLPMIAFTGFDCELGSLTIDANGPQSLPVDLASLGIARQRLQLA